MNDREIRVSLYGLFGIGNLGNEGSLAAFADYLRSDHPHARLMCMSADPAAVKDEHALGGTRLMARPSRPGSHASTLYKVWGRVVDVPRSLWLAGETDVLVVPGMGVFEETLGVRPWGLPYWLFSTVAACRVRGKKVAVVSVGAECPTNFATRALFRWTLRLATYRSYRDRLSRDAALAMGVKAPGDVRPDIAFALPQPPLLPVRSGHVAVGVMAYYGSHDDPIRGAATWERYVESMAEFVGSLIDGQRTVTLVIGDRVDRDTAVEVDKRVRQSHPDLDSETLKISQAENLDALMTEMSSAEAVVASRFHNVVCALRLVKPTVSLSYAPKNDELMQDFGLGSACQSLGSLNITLLRSQLDQVLREHPHREAAMQGTVDRYKADLDAQFRRLSQEILGQAADRQSVMT